MEETLLGLVVLALALAPFVGLGGWLSGVLSAPLAAGVANLAVALPYSFVGATAPSWTDKVNSNHLKTLSAPLLKASSVLPVLASLLTFATGEPRWLMVSAVPFVLVLVIFVDYALVTWE